MPHSTRQELRAVLHRHTYLYLLIALGCVLIASPLFDRDWHYFRLRHVVVNALITAMVATGIVANRARPFLFWTGCALGALTFLTSWSSLFIEVRQFSFARFLLPMLFCGFISLMILVAVVKDHGATARAVHGAICTYLLMGLAWAFLYASLEYVQQDPLEIAHRRSEVIEGREHTHFSQLVYFSFVTLSSVGYGDITPTTPVAEIAAWTEAVMGQLYLAILMAWTVNALIPRGQRQSSEPD